MVDMISGASLVCTGQSLGPNRREAHFDARSSTDSLLRPSKKLKQLSELLPMNFLAHRTTSSPRIATISPHTYASGLQDNQAQGG